jgi:hypothetical protein
MNDFRLVLASVLALLILLMVLRERAVYFARLNC